MTYKVSNIEEYLTAIPEERKPYFDKLRQTILDNLPEGFKEQLTYGMIGYVVPQDIYPDGYHCKPDTALPFANIASQKNFIALYHMGIYANKELLDWFVAEYPKHCKRKLNMGKSCIRFKKMEDIPYELIGQLMQKMSVKEWIALYETALRKKK